MAKLTYKQELIEAYHNIYKSINNVRPRGVDFNRMSIIELQCAIDRLDNRPCFTDKTDGLYYNEYNILVS
jgi:hypothetical protein